MRPEGGGGSTYFFGEIHNMNDIEKRVTACLVPDADRADFVHRLFGLHFPLRLEPTVFNTAGRLAPAYCGGFWHFHALANGGFYMAPDDDTFEVASDNGYEGRMSAEALGITACLYAYSNLSFGAGDFADLCGEHYHLLREFAVDHAESRAIMAACD